MCQSRDGTWRSEDSRQISERAASLRYVPELTEVAVGQGCPLWLDMCGPHCPTLGATSLRSSYLVCEVLWSRALVTGGWAGSQGCHAGSMARYLINVGINGYIHLQHQIRKLSTVFEELPGEHTCVIVYETTMTWKAFRITNHLWRESTGHMRSQKCKVFGVLFKLLNKRLNCRCFETPRRLCNSVGALDMSWKIDRRISTNKNPSEEVCILSALYAVYYPNWALTISRGHSSPQNHLLREFCDLDKIYVTGLTGSCQSRSSVWNSRHCADVVFVELKEVYTELCYICFCFKHKELWLCSRTYKINSHLEFHEMILHTAYSMPMVGSRYNTSKSRRIPDSRHPIACLFGWAMGCLLCAQSIFCTSLIVI